jgi:hypothetical protein
LRLNVREVREKRREVYCIGQINRLNKKTHIHT